MKLKLDAKDYVGAIVILENYLDGALPDYEYGEVENDSLIESCIKTIKLIYSLTEPLLLLGGLDYEERYLKAKENKHESKSDIK